MPEMEKNNSALSAEEIMKFAKKIEQNEAEQKAFKENLHNVIKNNTKINKPLNIGSTPNALVICGAEPQLEFTISKSVIDKCLKPEVRDENGKLQGKTGHGLAEEQLLNALDNVKNPTMILKGNRPDTLVVICDYKDDNDRQMLVAVMLNKKGNSAEINDVSSVYGRQNFADYVEQQAEKGNILAMHKEKANKLFQSIGKKYPKPDKFISFNDSISYTTADVKYPEQNFTEKTQFHEPIDHEKLLPFLNTKADYHTSRLETLRDKRDTQTEKIAKNEKKIEKLTAKANKLEDMNKMLKTLGNFPAVKSFIKRNEEKIKAIREEKIPKREEKILQHKNRIAEIDRKSDVIGHKLERCVALSDTVKSFAIVGKERQQTFAQAMDRLHVSTRDCLIDKKEAFEIKLEKAEERYSRANAEEKIDRLNNMNKCKEQLDKLNKKIDKLGEQIYSDKDEQTIDKLFDNTTDIINKHIDKEDFSIPTVSEEICTSNSDIVLNKDKSIEKISNQNENLSYEDIMSKGGIVLASGRAEEFKLAVVTLDNGKDGKEDLYLQDLYLLSVSGDESHVDKISKEEAVEIIDKKNLTLTDEGRSYYWFKNLSYEDIMSKGIVLASGRAEAFNDHDQMWDDDYAVVTTDNGKEDFYLLSISGFDGKSKNVDKISKEEAVKIIDKKNLTLTDEGRSYFNETNEAEMSAEVIDNKENKNGVFNGEKSGVTVAKKDAEQNLENTVQQNPHEYMKNAEMAMEDDYNMIDGIINNGRKDEPPLDIDDRGYPEPPPMSSEEKSKIDNTSEKGRKQKLSSEFINYNYFKSIKKEDREVVKCKSRDEAAAIMNKLKSQGVLYSARLNDKTNDFRVTIDKANKGALFSKEKDEKFVNPEYYNNTDKNQRFTQRMSEDNAKNAIKKLSEQGVEHSAVLNGNRSAVTINKSDYKAAQNAFFSLGDLKASAKAIKDKENKEEKDRSPISANKNKGFGLE